MTNPTNEKASDLKFSLMLILSFIAVGVAVFLFSGHQFFETKNDPETAHIDSCIRAVRQNSDLTETEKRRKIQRYQKAKQCVRDGWSDCFKELCQY